MDSALANGDVVLPPVVLTEMLGAPRLPAQLERVLRGVPLLELVTGYWQRAGELRRRILRRGLKARLADVLIAQSCLDHSVDIISRDRDFRHFAAAAGLRLLP